MNSKLLVDVIYMLTICQKYRIIVSFYSGAFNKVNPYFLKTHSELGLRDRFLREKDNHYREFFIRLFQSCTQCTMRSYNLNNKNIKP